MEMSRLQKINNRKGGVKTVAIFYRRDNAEATRWAKKIRSSLGKKHPFVKIDDKKPQGLVVLGGDGAILEAARKYQKQNPIILGLNLGRVGFLASAREPKRFLTSIDGFLNGRYEISERIMLEAAVLRNGKKVLSVNSLNDISVQNLLGVSEIEVEIENYPVQYIYGSGVLVATATGSTAYNLSAGGPIVMPHIKCFIVSEILDHNIPTPSMVVDSSEEIRIKVLGFRKRGLLSVAKTRKPVDMILSSDGANAFPVQKKDIVVIRRSPQSVRFAELEKGYFFKSLQEKFGFK